MKHVIPWFFSPECRLCRQAHANFLERKLLLSGGCVYRMDIGQKLVDLAEGFGIKISGNQADMFQKYAELLLEWNEKINLTAITAPEEISEKHFLDSLTVLLAIEFKEGAKLIDIGTGAGFPGMPLKIMRPDFNLTLLDGMNKRLVFLREVCESLGLEAEILHRRAEEAGRDKHLRESFDIAVSRAVAPLNILAEYCVPMIKMRGYFVAMKGPEAINELERAENAIVKLGVETTDICKFALPTGGEREVVLMRKKSFTPEIYPRHGGTITKHPL